MADFINVHLNLSEAKVKKLFGVTGVDDETVSGHYWQLASKKGEYFFRVTASTTSVCLFRQFLHKHMQEKKCPLVIKKGPVAYFSARNLPEDVKTFLKKEIGFTKKGDKYVLKEVFWPPKPFPEEKEMLKAAWKKMMGTTSEAEFIVLRTLLYSRMLALDAHYPGKKCLQKHIHKIQFLRFKSGRVRSFEPKE